MCNGNHRCQGNGIPSITTITVSTSSCAGCSSGPVEQGLQLDLVGRFGAECSTNGLDNSDVQDYGSNSVAQFNSTFLGGNDDHGLGHCNNVSRAEKTIDKVDLDNTEKYFKTRKSNGV